MQWEPEEQAWFSYIKLELRYKEIDRARAVYERYILYSTMCILPLLYVASLLDLDV